MGVAALPNTAFTCLNTVIQMTHAILKSSPAHSFTLSPAHVVSSLQAQFVAAASDEGHGSLMQVVYIVQPSSLTPNVCLFELVPFDPH